MRLADDTDTTTVKQTGLHVRRVLCRLIDALMTDDRRRKATRLLSRHQFDHSLAETVHDDALLVDALEALTPWQGDEDHDSYDDIAFLHGHALARLRANLCDAESFGRLHEALTSSLEDWMDLAVPADRSALISVLMNLNSRLLESWRVGSRTIVSILLLLNPDQESLVEGLARWPKGRFDLRDMLRTCDQAEAIGLDPIYALCWDGWIIKNVEEDKRPMWNDLGTSTFSFTEPMLLGREEIDGRLSKKARGNLVLAIRAAVTKKDGDA